jgi:hypothetical protein
VLGSANIILAIRRLFLARGAARDFPQTNVFGAVACGEIRSESVAIATL